MGLLQKVTKKTKEIPMSGKRAKKNRKQVKKNVTLLFGETLEPMQRQPFKVRWGLCKRILLQK